MQNENVINLAAYRRNRASTEQLPILTDSEEDVLFAALGEISGYHLQLAIFLIDTGSPIADTLHVQWKHFVDEHVVFTASGRRKKRKIPLTSRALRALKDNAERPGGPFFAVEPFVFLSDWKAAASAVGLGHKVQDGLGVLRNTCAYRLLSGGIDLLRVQVWLGDPSIKATLDYANRLPLDPPFDPSAIP